MNRAQRKLTAWIAAAALLFSALSPAMAATLFSDRPDILARVLALPADIGQPADPLPVQGEAVAHCPHDGGSVTGHHDSGTSHGDNAGDHAAHGIYCSFCLAASAGVTLPAVAPATAAPVAGAAEVVPMRQGPPPPARAPSTQQARAPPFLF